LLRIEKTVSVFLFTNLRAVFFKQSKHRGEIAPHL
jgi:hypothetical protein